MTMVLFQSVTLSSSASSIEFTNLPQSATDFRLVLSGRSTNADSSITIRFNGSTSSINMIRLTGYGDAGNPDSAYTSSQVGNISGSDYTASTFGNFELYVYNYASTSTFKRFYSSGVSENNASLAVQNRIAGGFNTNTAISSVGIFGNFASNSSASLYLVTKA